jgi:hypothetical protein
MPLGELATSARRLAIVGLAKNTGKTEALNALLGSLAERGRSVGVTSIGRDGEQRDAIDARIAKPRVRLVAGSLVATTDALLRAAGVRHRVLRETRIRTPLGRVLLARVQDAGALEIAGPSSASDIRELSEAMLEAGAEHVLVDGAIDRRAASSPAVCDALVVATGAVLDERIERVVALTVAAVELARLPRSANERARERARAGTRSALIDADGTEPLVLPPRFLLSATAAEIAPLLRRRPEARWLAVGGALCEPFLGELLAAARGQELELVVADSTRVFLAERTAAWYEAQGLAIRVAEPIGLSALTVNPVAPGAHRFETARLQALLRDALPGVPVLDVRDPLHRDAPTAAAAAG